MTFRAPAAALLIGLLLPLSGLRAQTDEELRVLAAEAYQAGHIETGHLHLRTILSKTPGNMAVTVEVLAEILKQSRRSDAKLRAEQPNAPFSENPAAEEAARELCALERLGMISANSTFFKRSATILVNHCLHDEKLFEARELVDRLAEENDHDLFWQILQAHVYRRLKSAAARPLFEKLKGEMIPDHPDEETRKHWAFFAEEWDAYGESLPLAIKPLVEGSPLPFMEPDDPDLEWDLVTTRPASLVAPVIDRVAAKALTVPQIVPWRDKSGLTDPVRALDLHLLDQPVAQLQKLREIQEQRYELEKYDRDPTDTEILFRFRRYPWAPSAQSELREFANQALFAGHYQSALRSFQDLLDHAIDQENREAAQVGIWTTRTQLENPGSPADLLLQMDPDRPFPWLGKPTPASTICRQLIEKRGPSQSATPVVTAQTLRDLTLRPVRIPPTSPWTSSVPTMLDLSIAGTDLLVSGRDLLALFDGKDPARPLWIIRQPPTMGENKNPDKNYPGFFRPQHAEGLLFTRWGFNLQTPRGIAALDSSTGAILWSEESALRDNRPLHLPLGDPTPADGLLFYLEWSSPHDLNHGRGRRLNLVCYDPGQRQTAWRAPIAIAGHDSDLTASLERSEPAFAVYGNRVTVSKGAIYSSSNCGLVARSDVRDGRTDWVYHYPPIPANERSVLNHGSAPIVAGSKVICMPRDTRQVFALDQRTGRLLWENTLVLGVQLVGIVDDLLVVRGQSLVAGLDVETGLARWYRPADHVIGRLTLLRDSVCMAQLDGLYRLDARTGQVLEVLPWGLSSEKPRAFALHGRDLYVVTDQPAGGPGRRIGQPLNAAATDKRAPLSLPLSRAWTLPRDNARITLPPSSSPLAGSAFVFSSGILERIDLDGQGRIVWQRFIDGSNPQVHLIGPTLLAIDYSTGKAPGLLTRIIAFDARNGSTLWEHSLDAPVTSSVNCGETQVFHDTTGRVVAVDLHTGRRAWQRNFGNGFQMRLAWDGTKLHVFFVSRLRSARHIIIEPSTGSTLSNRKIAARTSDDARNAELIDGDYYEVTVEPVKTRYVRLTSLAEINGREWASISELQIAGKDGRNLPREGWSATASNSETAARYDTRPQCVLDGDPVTWWHTKWLGGDAPLPHSITIDMKQAQVISAVRYLPAEIVNNNGTIREYELHVSEDGKNWGIPVAKGFMVNETRVDHAYATAQSIVFESRPSNNKPLDVFRYQLDGRPATLVRRNSHVVFMKDPYFMIHEGDKLIAFRFDEPGYRFEVGNHTELDLSALMLEGDRLILGRKSVVVADLAQRKFIVAPGEPGQLHNKEGLLIREGSENLLKIVSQGEQGQAVFRFSLQTGQRTHSTLAEQSEAFRPGPGLPVYDGLLLFQDGSAVSAWVGAVP